MSDIQNYFDFILPLVKNAGKTILDAKNVQAEIKNLADIVTIYDRKIEDILHKNIKEKYPNHKFIGEEESYAKKLISPLTSAPTWIIDPIDGTSNFVQKIPITAISVGLAIEKQQVMGIIFNPFLDELYTCIKGQGVYLNGEKIICSKVTDIKNCDFAYEISMAHSEKLRDVCLNRLKHLIAVVPGVRALGCATMSLAYVARGSLDAYQCDGLYPWDAAAGTLMVREAGGCVFNPDGTDFDLMNPSFIATSTKKLADSFFEIEKVADLETSSSK